MPAALQALLLALSPLLHVALGDRLVWLVGRLLGSPAEAAGRATQSAAALFVLGLLAHLWVVLVLALLGLPWSVAALLPLALGLLPARPWREILRALRPPLDPNFWLWFAVVAGLGWTLFSVSTGITTLWRNNWGDLAFHLGMIASFVFGESVPGEYHVFAGEPLSYPFFVNLWSAGWWALDTSFEALWRIFLFQWVALWLAVYGLLDGRRHPLLPWALLFGGGSYLVLGENSGQHIARGIPWTAFLSTVWVTQRAALLGACAALAGLRWFQSADDAEPARSGLPIALAATALSLAPLAHVHLVLVAALWCGLVLLARLPGSRRELRALALFTLFSLPALASLPVLLGKAGTLELVAGWLTGEGAPTGPARLPASAGMWLAHAPAWLALAALLWALTRDHVRFVPLLLLFLAGNVVQLAVWDWDQLKVFLGCYVVLLAVWSATPGRRVWLAHFACVLLVVPGVAETLRVLRAQEVRTVYSEQALARARAVREHTSRQAVIAAAPRHNSPVTLTGRRLFHGYEGTLWSHGIDHEARARILESLDALAACDASVCPTHLFWGDAERELWGRDAPGPGFAPSGLEFLFALPPVPGSGPG